VSETKLDIAFWNYDRTQALVDGRVKIAGADAKFHSGRIVTEIFEAMIRDRAYDVSELGMTYFLRTIEVSDPPYFALPVFPVRSFRHGAIYINKNKGIDGPRDLNGRTIGELAVYGHDAGVMPKGILSDEYSFRPDTCDWIIGGIDFPIRPVDYIPQNHPESVKVTYAEQGADLGQMLEAGEIDALISADIPACVLHKSPNVGLLFEDYETAERDYFRRTGIFPIMHTVVVRADLARDQPDLIKGVYKGFCDAKRAMVEQYVKGMTFNNMQTMIPWLTGLIGTNRDLMGEDWWPYGVKANRAAIDAVLRYHHEQGLITKRFAAEDIFVPYLLDT